MSVGILGRKLGMTQIYTEDGFAVPVTVVEAGPCVIVDIRDEQKNGYNAIVAGFGEVKSGKLTKPYRGVFEKNNLEPKRWLREFRVESVEGYEIGQEIRVDIFEKGEKVNVTGKSKGKGYAGVMKRHNFAGGPASHGSSKFHRQPGSAGGSSFPGHIFKGKTMPGRLGNERVTVKGLTVVDLDPENNLLLIKGAIPGPRNGLVMIHKTGSSE
ncbi:50S ribosomal protein L3 [Thermovirga sp.]|uniref:50S ribosomal protein L3 n=1 Tax=Thermovirga sp. TaxID=2699834 RepID=UPI0017940111|nr:50S ribosomal protein L3 [Thermovirga sp.]MBO8153651.1 50S ribosomal protein L3 [Thermovirga sp.]HDH97847.1 50S ribosomal protein L3 [Deltaproteobacteria bacterium]